MNKPAMPCTVYDKIKGINVSYSGFTKLESACLQLKVTHPDAPEWLNELVERSRQADLSMMIVVTKAFLPKP